VYVTQYCTHEDQPSLGETCGQFLQTLSFYYETFEAFSPGIGAKCDNWKLRISHPKLHIFGKSLQYVEDIHGLALSYQTSLCAR
jgi:hypothetical protein